MDGMSEMTPEQARQWAELADRERAESPDGKTGFQRWALTKARREAQDRAIQAALDRAPEGNQ